MRWNSPREAALMMAKITLAFVVAMLVTILMILIIPFGDISPRTPEKAIVVIVFYTTWALLMFKLIFGEYIPRQALKNSEGR